MKAKVTKSDGLRDLLGLTVNYTGVPHRVQRILTSLHVHRVLVVGKWQLILTHRKERV